MSETYDPKTIEEKWQRVWDDARAWHVDNPADPAAADRAKSYVLEMLPYPSGSLHLGHLLVYTIGDVVMRFRRRNGLTRPPPDGLGRVRPAGRERRDQGGRAPARDHRAQHRQHPPHDAPDGLVDRLGRGRSRPTIRATTAGSSGSSSASSSRASPTARARR